MHRPRPVAVSRIALTAGLAVLVAATAPALVPPPGATAGAHAYREAPDDPPPAWAARDDLAARSPGRRVRVGPYRSVQVNVDAAGQNIVGDAANEPSIAVDPGDPQRLVIGWRQFDSVASNFRQAGWAHSDDGGASWTFPGVLEPGVFRSDPVLDVDSSGVFFYNSLEGDFSMDFWRSVDGGLSWLPPVEAFGGDKNWAVIDRTGGIGEGNVYGTWQRAFGCCGTDIFTRSTDGGASFEFPVDVARNPTFGVLAVGPDGEVYSGGIETQGFFQDFDTFVVARSDDAEDPGSSPTFTTRTVDLGGPMVLGATPNPDGLLGQAWVAVDRSSGSSRGHVYLLGSVNPVGGDPLDIHIARSVDGGASWEPWIRVNDDPGNDWQWFGTLSVAPNRRLDAVWNDTRASGVGTVSELRYAYSYDGGRTWSENVPVSPPFDSTVGWPNQNKLGDYYDMVSDASGADVAYAATLNGEQDVYHVRVFPDCNGNGVSDVDDIAAGTSQDADGDDVPDECEEGLLAVGEPTPGVAGQDNTWAISGATPGETVLLLGSTSSGATQVPGCGDLTLTVGSPRLLGSAVADASGEATVTRFIPPGAGGEGVFAQAVEQASCRKSNLVLTVFP